MAVIQAATVAEIPPLPQKGGPSLKIGDLRYRMNESQILRLGVRLLKQHGLGNWTLEVRWFPSPDILAQCHRATKRIDISWEVIGMARYMVRVILLHEIAHALVRCNDSPGSPYGGHGPGWAAKAAELGVPRWDIQRHTDPPPRIVKY